MPGRANLSGDGSIKGDAPRLQFKKIIGQHCRTNWQFVQAIYQIALHQLPDLNFKD